MFGNTVIDFYRYWTTIVSYVGEEKILLTKITICSLYKEYTYLGYNFLNSLSMVCSHIMIYIIFTVVPLTSPFSWVPSATQSTALGGYVG